MTIMIFADGSVGHRDTTPSGALDGHNRDVREGRLAVLLGEHILSGGSVASQDDGRPGGPVLALSDSSPGRGVRKALESVQRTQNGLVWMPESEARKALGPSRYRKVQGRLKRKRIGSRRWVVRRADVLAALDGQTPRAGAGETIARAIGQTRGIGFSDDISDDEPHAALRQRRRYRRGE